MYEFIDTLGFFLFLYLNLLAHYIGKQEDVFMHIKFLKYCSFLWSIEEVLTQDEKQQLNTPASLKCSLQSSQEVLVVTWQKKKAVSPENMVTFSKNHGVVIQPAYRDKLNITQLGLQNSTITFWNTTLEDEGCYMCLFNTFGSGKISGTSCLTLYGENLSIHWSALGNTFSGTWLHCLVFQGSNRGKITSKPLTFPVRAVAVLCCGYLECLQSNAQLLVWS